MEYNDFHKHLADGNSIYEVLLDRLQTEQSSVSELNWELYPDIFGMKWSPRDMEEIWSFVQYYAVSLQESCYIEYHMPVIWTK